MRVVETDLDTGAVCVKGIRCECGRRCASTWILFGAPIAARCPVCKMVEARSHGYVKMVDEFSPHRAVAHIFYPPGKSSGTGMRFMGRTYDWSENGGIYWDNLVRAYEERANDYETI